jgi:hypothetical protein
MSANQADQIERFFALGTFFFVFLFKFGLPFVQKWSCTNFVERWVGIQSYGYNLGEFGGHWAILSHKHLVTLLPVINAFFPSIYIHT